MIELDEEDKRKAINLAMTIECGIYPMENVLNLISEAPDAMESIIWFWWDFNKMTRDVARAVIYEKCKKHLQKCLAQGTVPHP